MRPFCDLTLRAIRVASAPTDRIQGQPIRKLLVDHRLQTGLNQKSLKTKLGVSLKTLQNWERGNTKPLKRFWPAIASLLNENS